MKRKGVWAAVAAVTAGLAGCQLTLGLDDYQYGNDWLTGGNVSTGGYGGEGGYGGAGGSGAGPGSAAWSFTLGSNGEDTVNAVAVGGPSNHIYVTGKVGKSTDLGCPPINPGDGGTSIPIAGGYVAEFDTSGQCAWGVFFGLGAEGTGVAVDATGAVSLSGNFTDTLFIGPQSSFNATEKAFFARFKSGGEFQWIHVLSSGVGVAHSTGLAANDSRVYVGGYHDTELLVDGGSTFSNGDAHDGFVIGCDTNDAGACSFSAQITGTASNNQEVYGVSVRTDNSQIATAGSSEGDTGFNSSTLTTAPVGSTTDVFLGLFGKFGATDSGKLYGGLGKQYGRRVAYSPASNGTVFLGGTFVSTIAFGNDTLFNQGGDDVFLARVESGSPTKAIHFGSDDLVTKASETITGLAVNASEEVYVAGALRGQMTLAKTLSSAGGDDIYVTKLDPMLTPVWSVSFGDATDQAADAAAVDPADDGVIVAGHFQGTFTFDNGVTPLPTFGGTDIFVVKLRP